jgi:VWA domain containing CoxE-like protein
MSATPPAPAPEKRPRPSAAWLAFSARMTAQVAPVAGRPDLTVTVAPGAGRGAPACFVPASAEIEVNGDHLPVDPGTAAPANPADRERYPALWGATVHECAHAAHSRWRAPKGTDAAWSAAALALEESRIEARQVTRRPGDRAWLRACTCQIVIGDFAAASAPPASAAEAGSAAALILAREDAGILEAAEAEPVARAVAAVIGEEKLGQLRQVWREAHRTRDDDARGMVRLGRRWCRILGVQPDQPAPKADPSEAGGPPSPVAAAVGEATARVEDAARAEFAPPPPPFPPGQAEAREVEGKARRQAGDAASRVFDRDLAGGSGGTTGVTREPHEDEQAAARRLARALREASAGGRAETVISSATPPGRLRMRHAVAADAQRAAGAMPTAKPFTRVERRRVPAPPLAVGVACDVSGSMSGFTGPVASTAWVLARATASLPAARTATVTYGRQVRPVTYPGAVPARVAEFSAAGNREDFTTAVSALDGALGLSRPGATRILVIVSDGRYKGTQHADGQKLITRLVASGCLVIWIAPSDTANTMTGARVVILADPAATSQAVARAVAASARTA